MKKRIGRKKAQRTQKGKGEEIWPQDAQTGTKKKQESESDGSEPKAFTANAHADVMMLISSATGAPATPSCS
jgi:hypothetical protein